MSKYKGCIVIGAIPVAVYLVHAAYLVGSNFIHQAKWASTELFNYSYTIHRSSFYFLQGDTVIIVQNGKIASGSHPQCQGCPPQRFEELSIDSMFHSAVSCAVWFPWLTCSIQYDETYGYPEVVQINCPMPDACFDYLEITEFKTAP